MVIVGMNKLLLVIVFLVVLVGSALAVVNFALDSTTVKTQTVTERVREIVVKSGGGGVDLAPAAEQIEVRETQHYVFGKPRLELNVKNGVLTLDSDCKAALVKCYADLRVTVPPGIEVTVDTDSGDAILALIGRQRLVWAHTDSGNVEVLVANARAVDAQTDSGDVMVDVFDSRPRRVVARSDSGSIQVLVPKGDYAVDAQTDSGEVDIGGITRNDRAPNSIEARTDSGDITIRAQ